MSVREQMIHNNIAALTAIIAFIAIVLAVIGYGIRMVTTPPAYKVPEARIGTILSIKDSQLSGLKINNKNDKLSLYNQSIWQKPGLHTDENPDDRDYHKIYEDFELNVAANNETYQVAVEKEQRRSSTTEAFKPQKGNNLQAALTSDTGEQETHGTSDTTAQTPALVAADACVWNILQPHLSAYDKHKGKELVNSLINLDTYSVIITSDKTDLQSYGLLDPLAEITYDFVDGHSETLKIGYANIDNPSLYYAQFNDSNVVYVLENKVKAAFDKSLSLVDLQLSNNNPSDINFISLYREYDKFYLDLLNAGHPLVKVLKLQDGGNGDNWYVWRPFPYLANSNYVNNLVQYLAHLQAADCIDRLKNDSRERELQLQQYGLQNPAYEFALATVNNESLHFKLGTSPDRKHYYLTVSNSPYVYLIEGNLLDFLKLPKSNFLQKQPFYLNLNDLSAFTFTNKNYELDIRDYYSVNENLPYYDNNSQSRDLLLANLYERINTSSVKPHAPESFFRNELIPWFNKLLINKNDPKKEIEEIFKDKPYLIPKTSKDKVFIFAQNDLDISYFDKINTEETYYELRHIKAQSNRSTEVSAQDLSNEAKNKKIGSIVNNILLHLQSVNFFDIVWQPLYQANTATPDFTFTFTYKDGQSLSFDFYELSKGNYYMYVNNIFSHLILREQELNGSVNNQAVGNVSLKDLIKELLLYCKN